MHQWTRTLPAATALTLALAGLAVAVPSSFAGPAASGFSAPAESETAAQTRAVLAARHVQEREAAVRQQVARRAAARHAARAVAAQRASRQVAAQAAARAAARAAIQAAPTQAPAAVVAPVVVRRTESAVERGTRVLASLHYDWARLGYRIEFLPGKDGYLGMTIGPRKLVQIYVRSTQSDLVLAHSIAHELGHVLDFTRGDAATRAAYLTIRGLDPRSVWVGCAECSDFRTPAGDWAEVFAYWLAGPGDFRSQLAGAPSAAQLAEVSALFRV